MQPLKLVVAFLVLVSVAGGLVGCAAKVRPWVPKPATAPTAAVHCFDAVGHMPGTTPFILGGTCFCTPTEELMGQYHADGKLLDMELEDLLRAYEERSIRLESKDHTNCNNLCADGPHVLKGGRCMASPMAGSRNFEEIRFGKSYLRVKK